MSRVKLLKRLKYLSVLKKNNCNTINLRQSLENKKSTFETDRIRLRRIVVKILEEVVENRKKT